SAPPRQRVKPVDWAGQRRNGLGNVIAAHDMRHLVQQSRTALLDGPRLGRGGKEDDGPQPAPGQRGPYGRAEPESRAGGGAPPRGQDSEPQAPRVAVDRHRVTIEAPESDVAEHAP